MKQVIVKSLRVLWQILGVLLSVFVISVVRVLLREGFGLEVYTSTIGLIFVVLVCGVIWIFRQLKKEKKVKTDAHESLKLSLEDQPKGPNGKMLGRVAVVIAILTLLGGVFYWFQVRPSQIRKDCDSYARGKYSNYNAYLAAYTACLHQKGLE